MTPIMKNVLLFGVGAVGLFTAAKRFGLISVDRIKTYVNRVINNHQLKDLLNVDRLKEMVGLTHDEPELATA